MNTENKRKFIIDFVYMMIWLVILLFILKTILPAIVPFVLAFLVAYSLRKPIRKAKQKFKTESKLISFVAVLIFYSTIGVILTITIIYLLSAFQSLFKFIPTWYLGSIEPVFHQMMSNIQSIDFSQEPALGNALQELFANLIEAAGKMISSFSVWTVSFVSNTATSIPGLFIGFFVMIISSFFITMDYDKIVGFVMHQLNDSQKELVLETRQYVSGTLFICIRSYFLIMTLTFIELNFGLHFLGINHSMLIALGISIFDILPVLGTGGVMIPWGIFEMIRGNFVLGIGLLLLYLAITVIRNIVEPKIVGAQLGLHPVLTLMSMFVGANWLGFIGVFGFPILLSLLKNLNDKGIINILKP